MDKASSSLLFASPFSFSCSPPLILHPLLQNLLRSFNLILVLSTNPHRHLGFLHGWMVGGELSVGSFLASGTMIIIIIPISIPLLHLCQLASLFPLVVSVCFVGGADVNSTPSFHAVSRFGVVICWLVRNVVAFVFTWLYFLFL